VSDVKENMLTITHPHLIAEWHPGKNGNLVPDQITAGSKKKAWWRCQHDPSHEWEAVIYSRTKGSGCPFCSGRVPTSTTSLGVCHPHLIVEWHPTKNGEQTPYEVKPHSDKKVWWQCKNDPSHEWFAAIKDRVHGNGCPLCRGGMPTATTCLSFLHPQLTFEWHPTRNGSLTPVDVVPGGHQKVWWRCTKDFTHEWESVIYNRVKGNGCPYCAGKKATPTTSLFALYISLAEEWHPEKNSPLTPADVVPGGHQKVWWRCLKDPTHVWQAVIKDRVSGKGCPFCAGRKVSPTTSLQALHPLLIQEWHPIKNGELTPADVVPGSNKRVWWRCLKDSTHEWEAIIANRVYGTGCPICANLQVTPATSLEGCYPILAAEWHPEKNSGLTPYDVVPGSSRKVWWQCSIDPSHEWFANIHSRVKGSGCPMCSGRTVTPETALATHFPQLADEWHPTKNGNRTPLEVMSRSGKKAWWRCSADPTHEWEAVIASRADGRGCPYCNRGWTIEAIRLFVASLKEHLPILTPAELYLLFQQSGLLTIRKKGKTFVKALATGRFPLQELEKFVAGELSLVDQFVEDPDYTLEQSTASSDTPYETDMATLLFDEMERTSSEHKADDLRVPDEPSLPIVETRQVLATMKHLITSSSDEEAVEFLISSAIAKIWKHAFHDEIAAIAQAEQKSANEYTERVRNRFLEEYWQAKKLSLPEDYAFHDMQGNMINPNLMQRLVAIRVRNHKRVGNWSGTGAGKTLSAILTSQVVNAKLTIVCCPNSVVEGWEHAIGVSFQKTLVQTKTFTPIWGQEAANPSGLGMGEREITSRYLILNYEAFQVPDSIKLVQALVERELVDCVIIDEIHYAKQRKTEDMSRRRKNVATLITLAAERNSRLCVLGMSATPVINNLQEGKSMIELVTGVAHDDLDIRPTLANCIALHQHLVRLGIRWMPEYSIDCNPLEIDVDCSSFLDEIRQLGEKGTPLALEQILTLARLPIIRQYIKPKTLIYTHLIQGIDRLLRDALVVDGWKVGFYTGEDKAGLKGFLAGDVDVLIGSSAIGTGVDGLQHVCNHLIVNVLPWTAAEFEQLKGRVFRQGQQHQVTMVLPLTYAYVNGERWSWCESKMNRLHFKKSIADAAVDGVVPEGHLRSPAQAYQDLMAWLHRLDTGEVTTITRSKIVVPLPQGDEAERQRCLRSYGTFSTMNRHWNQTRSEKTHQRLQSNPEEWAQYHSLYREKRQDWAVIPYEEMIRWCQERSGKVIGDFGCGEALLANAISDRHTVYSIDHVAINDEVLACDMAHVPLDDESLDVAVFSLSLMGANFTDYLREAHRTLKLDGQIHIIEATERFSDREQFAKNLEHLGFDVIRVEDLWKFTHIRAMKTERQGHEDFTLCF
jgi:Hypothetical methyltransferase/Probable Zinc-ribbon domain/Type III restriction enzyme, res subunit/Helicase conserved C-terminal domain